MTAWRLGTDPDPRRKKKAFTSVGCIKLPSIDSHDLKTCQLS